jgi:hypothetical protein
MGLFLGLRGRGTGNVVLAGADEKNDVGVALNFGSGLSDASLDIPKSLPTAWIGTRSAAIKMRCVHVLVVGLILSWLNAF